MPPRGLLPEDALLDSSFQQLARNKLRSLVTRDGDTLLRLEIDRLALCGLAHRERAKAIELNGFTFHQHLADSLDHIIHDLTG